MPLSSLLSSSEAPLLRLAAALTMPATKLLALLSAWLEPTEPSPMDALLNESIPQCVASFALCYVLDAAVVRIGCAKSRWFTLHTLVNIIVVALSADDAYYTLKAPMHAVGGPASTMAISLIIALHAYHAVFFKLSAVDIVHHVVSVGILGPLAVWFRPGVFMNYVCFFVSGLPGGIDYAMLALVKHGYMDALTEKYWNTKINVWMRGPFLVIGSFIAYQSALESTASGSCKAPGLNTASLVTAAVLLWNGQFFAERVIVNYGMKSKESTAEMYASSVLVNLPRNMSKNSLSKLARNLSRDSLLRLAEGA